jgi:hypothetical protein
VASSRAVGPVFETANLFVRRELFERLGGFEPWLSPARSKELAEDVVVRLARVRAGRAHGGSAMRPRPHAVPPRGPATTSPSRLRPGYFPAMVEAVSRAARDVLLAAAGSSRAQRRLLDLALAGAVAGRATRAPVRHSRCLRTRASRGAARALAGDVAPTPVGLASRAWRQRPRPLAGALGTATGRG